MLFLSLLLSSAVLGQYGDAPSAPTTTSAARVSSSAVAPAATASSAPLTANQHRVIVGGGKLIFSPNNLTIPVGDAIVFEFHYNAHSVVQSSFLTPCFKSTNGLDSGIIPVAQDAVTFPTYVVTVADLNPRWFFCSQTSHCLAGMVFSLNAATTGNTTEAFIANAKNALATPAVAIANATSTASGAMNSASGLAASFVSAASTATGSVAPSASPTARAASASSVQIGSLAGLVLGFYAIFA